MAWIPPPYSPPGAIRALAPQPVWRRAIEAIRVRHALPAAELAPFPTGSDVVWSAGEFVVKLTPPVWREELRNEAETLAFVAGRLPVETPRVVATGALEGWPYVVLSRLRGVALARVWPALARAERLRLARELGRLARALHELPHARAPAARCGWEGFWAECRRDVARRHAHPDVPGPLAASIDGFLESAGPIEAEARAFLHTELLDEHVLVVERAGRAELGGLIDFADSRVGAPEYEFAAPVEFVFRGETGLLRAFLEAYGVDSSALDAERSRRMLAWALCHRFGSLRRMLAACGSRAPETLEELAGRLYGLE